MNSEFALRLRTAVRERSPLVHNITNLVVANSSANILLAVGAAPVMAHSRREVEAMVAIADALVLNIGTLDEPTVESMILAGVSARERGLPIVLDPVGAGATAYRTQTAMQLLETIHPTLVRGNASEIAALTSATSQTRGVDATTGISEELRKAAAALADHCRCTIAISGGIDHVVGGEEQWAVRNGCTLMTRVTGTGCGLSAWCAACLGTRLNATPAKITAAAFALYGACGEIAAAKSRGPGSFEPAFLDVLAGAPDEDLAARLDYGTITAAS